MKTVKINKRIIMANIILLAILNLFCLNVIAQDKSASSIQLSYYKKADKTRTIVAKVKGKNEDKKFVPVANVKVNFYFQNKKDEQLIKGIATDMSGNAELVLPKIVPLDDENYFTIIAKIENDSKYEDADEQVHYTDASFNIKIDPKDTSRLATVEVTSIDNKGKEVPVKGVEVTFYVQRLFGIMPASEDPKVTTDKSGEAEFNLPKDIAGDTLGNLTIVARIEDNAQFGNIETKVSAPWAIALIPEKNPFPRALWEPKAPPILVITISTLFGGVWFTYFFMFWKLSRIKKDGMKSKVKA